jgi:hypothetical protein
MSDSKIITEMPKNARETIHFRLGEFKGHRFVDMRIFTKEHGKEPSPTKKGLAVSPHLWPQFRAALAQVEQAMIEQGWLDREDLL